MALTAACDEVRTSRGFHRALEWVLVAGNYLSASAPNYRPALAFALSSLGNVRSLFFVTRAL